MVDHPPQSSCVSMTVFKTSVGFSTFALSAVSILLSTVAWTEGAGRPRLIGSSQPVVAAQGGDVILPCHVEPQLNVENMTVQWWRPDVPLDPTDPLSNYRYAHSYHNNRDEEDRKMPSYAGRTALLKDELKHGNVSLQIRNLTLSDEGRYRCHVPQLGSASVIQLVVDSNSVKTWTPTQHPRIIQAPGPTNETNVKGGRHHLYALIPGLVSCILLVGFLVKLKFQRQNLPGYEIPPTKLPPV